MKYEVTDDMIDACATNIKQEVDDDIIDVCGFDDIETNIKQEFRTTASPDVFHIDPKEFHLPQNASYRYPQMPAANVPFSPLNMFLYAQMFPNPWMLNTGLPVPYNYGFPGLINPALIPRAPPTARYQCSSCRQVCSSESELTIHIKVAHSDGPITFSCEECDKIFYDRTTLTRHIKHVHQEKAFKCRVCDKKFSKKWNLNIHLNMHTGKKPFTCPICSKSFSDPNNCRQHKRSCMVRHRRGSVDSDC